MVYQTFSNKTVVWFYTKKYQSIEMSLHRWDKIAQNLKFNYLYKSHCKSCELLGVLYYMIPLNIPKQFVGFAVTLVKIIKF
jgi:hypothetical protein